jgi:hypothetical protein
MRSNAPEALARAEALFKKKEKSRTEGIVAAAEYEERQKHELSNIARLRRLRLERDRQAGN